MRRILVLILVLAAATVVPALGASAGPGPQDLEVDLVSAVEPLTFRAEVGVDPDCASVTITAVEANETPVTPLSVVPDDTDPNAVFIVLPSDTPPGELSVEAECDYEGTILAQGSTEWGALAVTKVVEGTVPAGAAFVVNVACVGTQGPPGGPEPTDYTGVGAAGILEELDVDLEFGASGGTKYVYFDGASECLITEPVNGGAAATTITPAEILNDEPEAYASTVTNTFPVVVEPAFTG